MCDLRLPTRSADRDVPRFTWWPRKGTKEWAQYTFDRPRRLCVAEVYWFDDTGGGQCRVPASWRLLVRHGGKWQPVQAAGEYGVATDTFNAVGFEPVPTDAVRLEVQLRPGFSGGLLEWRVR